MIHYILRSLPRRLDQNIFPADGTKHDKKINYFYDFVCYACLTSARFEHF